MDNPEFNESEFQLHYEAMKKRLRLRQERRPLVRARMMRCKAAKCQLQDKHPDAHANVPVENNNEVTAIVGVEL